MCVSVCHCICLCVLCFSIGSVSCLVLLSLFDFLVSDLSYCISDAHLFSDREKGSGSGLAEELSGETGRRWGKGSHNQNLLYEKKIIFNKRKNCRSVFKE